MKARAVHIVRLYAVSEAQNENGLYNLVPFDEKEAEFNEEFEGDDLDNKLNALLISLYGGGFCVEIDEDTELETCGDFIRIQVEEHRVEVPGIIDKINADSDSSKTYCLVDGALEDACFVVAQRVTP